MTSQNRTWESLKAKYLREVEKALSSVEHPRIKDVLADVSAHLDQRFAELEPDRRSMENFQSIITEMGPASDYAELLDPGAGRPGQGVRLKYVVGSAVAAVFVIVGGILLIVRMFGPPQPVTTEEFRRGFLEKIDKFEIDTATLKDVVKVFGEPLEYIWGSRILDRKSLPGRYVVVYPDGFHVFMVDNKVIEVRHEGPGTGYAWRGKLRVGSSLEEAIDVLGPPKETAEGGKKQFRDGVLYKDIEGRRGHCYYGRSDVGLRLFFADYKVAALYVTRSGWVDGLGGGNLSRTVRQSDLVKSFPKIDRRPKPTNWERGEMKSLPGYNPDSPNPFQVDLRGYDLSKLDLRDFLDNLLYSTFDERTIWPDSDRMPKGFDWKRLVEIGKNPGLGVRKLHEKGITGRDVGIAIIDNPLLVDHREYVERLRLYEEINVLEMKEAEGGHGADAHMHGTAAVSIAVGKTLGVAPEADVYYVATWPFDFGPKGAKGDTRLNFKYRAQAVNRILEINKQLPKDKKIRVISMSIGWDPSQEGYKEITEAMEKAKAEGMLVICSSTEQVHGLKFHGLGRSPLGDPDDFNSYGPASWGQHLSWGKDRLLVPMDSRTTASPTGADEYVFYRRGGWSWAIPYIAGVYALAAQVDPKIYPERFWALAMKTGSTVEVENKGSKMSLGSIAGPVELIGAIEAGDLSNNDAVTAELARYKTSSESTPDNVEFRKDFNAKVAQLDIDNGKVDDVIRIFGEPQSYLWGKKTFTKNNLPDRYLMRYPNGLSIFVVRDRIEELRHHGPGTGYLWRGKLRVGSSLEEAIDVLGPPKETAEGGKKQFRDGVLYKDIEGQRGHCYYGRSDLGIRLFFMNYEICALYVTRSDFDAGGGRSSNVRKAPASRPRGQGKRIDYHYTPTKEAGPVQWRGNKVISRVLPYPDLISLFIRLPIAHAAATGKGVRVAVVQLSSGDAVSSMVKRVVPGTDVQNYNFKTGKTGVALAKDICRAGSRVAVIPDVHLWSKRSIVELTGQLLADKVVVVVPSDLAEDEDKIRTVNALHDMGAVTVGRVDRQSLVMEGRRAGRSPFNRHIRKIKTDLFSTVGLEPYDDSMNPVASAAGVAALVLEKWPALTPREVRRKMVTGARNVWQLTSIETGQIDPHVVAVDPVTTEYKVRDESKVFRFSVLDAAGSLEVDTEIPWFLNMLNCHKAWEITKGRGIVVVVSDQGFHIRHPELVGRIEATKHFGPRTFDAPNQNFHGTDMARILLGVAPEARIIPVLCSNPTWEGHEEKIAKSFLHAVEQKADIITASWAGRFNKNVEFLGAVRKAVDSGVVVSWFHYPEPYPGLLRSRFTYSTWERKPCIGFADRFLTDPPSFHPVEIEAGLSGTAPQAAGIAALAKSVNPELGPKQIEELIFSNSTAIGSGVLVPDAHRIVLAARGG